MSAREPLVSDATIENLADGCGTRILVVGIDQGYSGLVVQAEHQRGNKGLLVITGRGRSICGKAQKSAATLNAQSGKQEKSSIKMATPCKRVAKHKK